MAEKPLTPDPRYVAKAPRLEDAERAFDLYVQEVGRVVYAWNLLHEHLGALFARVVGGHDSKVTMAVWYSPTNDRAQRDLLRSAVTAANSDPAWKRLPEMARTDLLWALDRINELGSKRDDAIHAPTELDASILKEGEMAAAILSGHRRVKNLVGKNLLTEFDFLENYAHVLRRFIQQATNALNADNPTWPERPKPPDRQPKKALLARRRPLPPV